METRARVQFKERGGFHGREEKADFGNYSGR